MCSCRPLTPEPWCRQIACADIVGALLEGEDGGEPSPGFRIWYCPRVRGSQARGKPARQLLKTGEMRARSAADAQRIIRAVRARAVPASGDRRIVVIINPKSGQGRCSPHAPSAALTPDRNTCPTGASCAM